jgi:DNA-directed RNA polymerase subunit RPC12/RpoP
MLEIHWEEIVLDLSDLFLKFDYDGYTYESVLVKSEKDYDVFKRVLVESHVNDLQIDQPTNSYGKEIADNIDENIEQNTIYNNDVINIVFKNNMIKLFKNDDDKIYSVEILSNKLTVAKKCKHCGEWLPEEHKRQIRCSACGELVDEGVEVCPHCNEKIVNAEPPKDNVAAEASGGQNPAAKNYISLIIIALSLVFTVFIVVYACNEKINNGDEPQQTTETVDSAAVDDDDSMAADTAVVDPATDDVENDEAVPADDQSTGQQGSSESESNGNYDDFTIK